MKKISIFIILLSFSRLAFGQQEPAAQQVLNTLTKKYQSYSTAKIDFALKAVNHQQQVTLDEKGQMIVEPKTNKYHLVMDGQEIIADGKQQWHILKEEQEVQITEVDKEPAESITPANIFTFYKTGFKYVSGKDEQVGGKTVNVVNLSPIDTKKSFFKVKLRVDKVSQQLFDVTIFDKSGSSYTYTIQDLTPNIKLNAKTFIFDKADFPNLEVVDLR